MPRVERLWSSETCVILASGPSLTREDVDFVRGKARVIAVNNNYTLAPWADAFYACDARWWKEHWPQVKPLAGLKFSLQVPGLKKPEEVFCFRKTGRTGLDLDPSGIRHGHNSGYQAINVAVHLGASRILLLGYDMKRGPLGKHHWHKDHPWGVNANYQAWTHNFRTLVEPLKAIGVDVVNCSRETALECFPLATIEDCLPASLAVAS